MICFELSFVNENKIIILYFYCLDERVLKLLFRVGVVLFKTLSLKKKIYINKMHRILFSIMHVWRFYVDMIVNKLYCNACFKFLNLSSK